MMTTDGGIQARPSPYFGAPADSLSRRLHPHRDTIAQPQPHVLQGIMHLTCISPHTPGSEVMA
jgi:hypothetical protein